MKKIVLAGGCFWGVEAYFKQLKGVENTSCGYANGDTKNPTYSEVCNGMANHAEAVEVTYNPEQISLEKLFEHFFRFVDPTSINKQGNDIGIQYRSGIYYYDELSKETAIKYLEQQQKNYSEPIAITVEPVKNYYLAEAYHQDYLGKNPTGYCHVDLGLVKEDEKK